MRVPATRRLQLLTLVLSCGLFSLVGLCPPVRAQDLAKLTVAYSSRSIAPVDYFIG